MYLVTKIFPEGSNAARELSRQFGNPSDEHWKELEKFIGFLRRDQDKIKFTITKPKELRAVSLCDSNYATNSENRKSVSGRILM